MDLTVYHPDRVQGDITVPGDKSISHRAVMMGSIAAGHTRIKGFLPAGDPLSTLRCMAALGVAYRQPAREEVIIDGCGLDGLQEAGDILDAGNSGTTIRLLAGLLAGRPFFSVLTGDDSLRRRPMGRVTGPLRQMGAAIWGRREGDLAPLAIRGRRLQGLEYRLPVASAQVKSALLLAGLGATGPVRLTEPALSRDHTERMLRSMGARLVQEGLAVELIPGWPLHGLEIEVPGDISAAAFFLVAASIIPGAELTIRRVGVNPTRTGIIDALQAMGAMIELEELTVPGPEPVADLHVLGPAGLSGIQVEAGDIPRLIDEIPVLAVAAAVAHGLSVIRGAGELRHKESDRLATITGELRRLGAKISYAGEDLYIEGPAQLVGTRCESHGDHRIAMALAVAGLVGRGETTVAGAECIDISFPEFPLLLHRIAGQ